MKVNILNMLDVREKKIGNSRNLIERYLNNKFTKCHLDNPLNWINYDKNLKNLKNYIGPCINCNNSDICFTKIYYSDGSTIRLNPIFCSSGCNYSYSLYK